MPLLTLNIPIDFDWSHDDQLVLFVGTENAAGLAASTPSGGVESHRVDAWADAIGIGGYGDGGFGGDGFGESAGSLGGFSDGGFGEGLYGANVADRVMEFRYHPVDRSGVLPVGVKARDRAGNDSSAAQTIVGLADPPRGARNLAVSATANPNEATLTWTESPDV